MGKQKVMSQRGPLGAMGLKKTAKPGLERLIGVPESYSYPHQLLCDPGGSTLQKELCYLLSSVANSTFEPRPPID